GMLQKLPLLVRKVSQWNPLYYYFYHNELAVELNALGRNAEARLALSVALRSPFASSYPEWHETLVEIDARETTAPGKTIAIPERREEAKISTTVFEADTSQAPSKISAADRDQARSSRERIAPESVSHVAPDASTALSWTITTLPSCRIAVLSWFVGRVP